MGTSLGDDPHATLGLTQSITCVAQTSAHFRVRVLAASALPRTSHVIADAGVERVLVASARISSSALAHKQNLCFATTVKHSNNRFLTHGNFGSFCACSPHACLAFRFGIGIIRDSILG